jgi:hypothetical protein
MKTIFRFVAVWLFAASILGFTSTVSAQAFDLKIYVAVEVEFGTETGKQYQVQGSSNLVDWIAIDQPECGTGFRSIDCFLPEREGFRLQNSTGCKSSRPIAALREREDFYCLALPSL